MTQIRRPSLLIVLAHPDEIFHGGVLAHLSERGVRVALACATDGEAGKPHPSVGQVDDLGALRRSSRLRSRSMQGPVASGEWLSRLALSRRGLGQGAQL